MHKPLKIALLALSMTCTVPAFAESISARLFQATADQARGLAIEKAAGSAIDAAKSSAEKVIYAETLRGVAVRVLDGDTIDLKTDKGITRIRFDSIDAPEKTQPFGQAAKKTLTSWIGNEPVTVKVTAKDRYGRSVGVVYLEDVNINRAMVEKGMAFANTQYLNDKSIQDIENKAKANRAGVWQIPEDQIVKPWDFRHKK